MQLRLITYNIHQCIGRDGNEDFSRVAAVLREINGDIVALQEVTSHDDKSADMLAYLATATGMQPVAGFTLQQAGGRYGNALLSRLPLIAVKRFDISIPKREPRGVIEALFQAENQQLMVWATHLGLGMRERHRQVDRLLQIVDAAGADLGVLLGDLNEWLIWSRCLQAICRHFPLTLSPATFPASWPVLKLDRIWVNKAEISMTLRAHKTATSQAASDHLPLVADLLL